MRSSELFGSVRTAESLGRVLDALIDGWCGRRSIAPLRVLLPFWPLHSPLTDGWGDLLTALKKIELLPENEVTHEERERLVDARRFVEHVVYAR